MEERLSGAGGELAAVIRAGVATVTLNRPSALNALSMGMLTGLAAWLDAWRTDPGVRTVVLRGAGDKAFCAGGDIRALREQALETGVRPLARGEARKSTDPIEFFIVEYRLDHCIHTYPKTIVAHLDGIVMGGGMGISQGAALRIVGHKTKMAMPETAIGLFPDVGGSYFLGRMAPPLGRYLGLAGPTLKAADAVYCGLADMNIGPPDASEVETRRADIDRHFAHGSAEAIVESLAADPGEWAAKTREALAKRSPTMLKVTLEQLKRGANLPLADCFRMELNLIDACFEQGDFLEGIRALVVDKDNAPRWNPPTLAEVRDEQVEAFFKPRWPAAQHPLANL